VKHATLTLMISAIIFGGNAIAAPKNKGVEASTQQQAAEFKIDTSGASTISTEKAIEESSAQGIIRDRFRHATVLSDIEREANDARLKAIEVERDMKAAEFIVDNVPPHILAAGDKAIQAYVAKNFVDVASTPKTDSVKTVWESTSTAIAAPVAQPASQKVTGPAPQIQPQRATPGKSGLSEEERAALGQLGLSEGELADMFGEKKAPPTHEKKEKKDAPKKSSNKKKVSPANVSITKIDVERVVIMGTSKFADVSLTLMNNSGGQQRRISRRFDKIGPGYIFSVEGAKFELVSLSEQQIVFENLTTKKTHQELIN